MFHIIVTWMQFLVSRFILHMEYILMKMFVENFFINNKVMKSSIIYSLMFTVYDVYIYTVASTCYWGSYGNISNVTDLVSTPHTAHTRQ